MCVAVMIHISGFYSLVVPPDSAIRVLDSMIPNKLRGFNYISYNDAVAKYITQETVVSEATPVVQNKTALSVFSQSSEGEGNYESIKIDE